MFKELSIVHSYTLECSFHGTEPVKEDELENEDD
jgi:hypothetical protein